MPEAAVHSPVRLDFAKRLNEAAQRWERIGRLMIAQGNTDGHDSIRLARKLRIIGSVVRSNGYAKYIPDAWLRKEWNKPTAELALMIQDRLPGGKVPGYRED